ncbi:GNAT family N-acetyltransferase [Primorskyibacter sp. 2E107]|uniref:GNAT family N-acetyltransferase n=1 Tax=Primorskyibacter sp. 2E107 TaxID=3403458 RepID=UPI003AF5C848
MIELPERLSGTILDLSPLLPSDEQALTEAASDPLIWAGHPAIERYKPQVFAPYFSTLLSLGGTLVARDKAGQVIGCSRYYDPPDAPGEVAIGYTFLVRAHWGGAANGQMKRLMLEHAFVQVSEVWLHIDPVNIRSQKATARIGAEHAGTGPLLMAGKSALRQSWRIRWADWRARVEER